MPHTRLSDQAAPHKNHKLDQWIHLNRRACQAILVKPSCGKLSNRKSAAKAPLPGQRTRELKTDENTPKGWRVHTIAKERKSDGLAA